MSLRIISGRAGTGKTTHIHREIVDELQQNPLGAPIFIIVPDQMSFKTEVDLTSRYGIEAIIRAQVFTFKRLAWFILQETGGVAREKIDSFGYRMLIRRILQDHKNDFSIFTQAANKRGFTQEVEQLLREFNQYDMTSERLSEVIPTLQAQNATHTLLAKMQDLQLISAQIEEKIGDSYVDGEGFFPLLVEQIRHSEHIHEAEVYIDGFTAFTIREFAIVEQLLLHAKRVTIVLPFDNEKEAADEQALFHRAAFTYDKLIQFAFEQQIPIENRLHLTTNYRTNCEELLHIESEFHEAVPQVIEAKTAAVQIFEAANRRAEVQSIAREIMRLVREENFRYSDIGIMYRQADVYDPILATTFEQHHIPYFMNEKRPMINHPFIEFMRSSFEAITSNWQYEPIFRAVKTDLFFDSTSDITTARQSLDQLENFIIAKGIIGNRWHDDNVWHYRRFRVLENMAVVQTDKELEMEEKLHRARDIVRAPLTALQKALKEAVTGRDIALALYQYAEQLQLYEKLQHMKEQELETSDLQFATEHDQVWNGWVNILDQFVLMFGDQDISLEEAAQILEEGYDSLQFSTIPPAIDEVTIATVEYSRFDNMRAVFIIGLNDGVYPMRIDNEGLLTDDERTYFKELDYELAPSATNKLLQENFLIYRALTSPTAHLYITYPVADEEGKSLLPSLYIQRLHKLFTVGEQKTLPHKHTYIDPLEEKETHVLDYLQHPHSALAFLATQLKEQQNGTPLTAEWQALQSFYNDDRSWREKLYFVTQPLRTTNKAEPLNEQLTEELYGQNLQASVSRIEKFYRCPYAHFATYGLRLEERAQYRLETFAMGDLFHEALRSILAGQEQPPKNYVECLQRAKDAVEPLVHIFSYRILESNARYLYIKEKLIRIVARTLFALTEHAKVAQFKPIVHEKPFGKKDGKTTEEQMDSLPPLEIDLEHNRKMYLRGQIDRIDAYEENNRLHLRVVDYKSSSKDLDLNEVYHGLSLQLLTYLEVAVKNAPQLLPDTYAPLEISPAGVLYVHVHDPLIRLEEYVDEQMLELQRLEKYRMDGLVTAEVSILEAMDQKLKEQKKSPIIPVTMTTKGELAANSKKVEAEEMPILQNYVLEKHKEAGNRIFRGETAIAPFKLKNRTACDYCQFKAVCQFDDTDVKQQYHQLAAKKAEEVLTIVKKECGYDVDNTDKAE